MLAYIYDDLADVDWRHLVACRGSAAVIPEARQIIGRAYREWRRARDVTRIAEVLGKLSDRQLRLLGLSSTTLVTDIEALVARNDVLRDYGELYAEPTLRLTYRTPRAELLPPAAVQPTEWRVAGSGGCAARPRGRNVPPLNGQAALGRRSNALPASPRSTGLE
jgi:hypothetical protein